MGKEGWIAVMEEVELCDDRLYLRPPRLGDAGQIYAACQDAEIQRWTAVPSPYSRADAEMFATDLVPTGWSTGHSAILGVFDRGGDRLLAMIGLHDIEEREAAQGGRAELGYWCAPWARGKGVVTDAGRLVCRWAFDELGLARIDWYAAVGNHRSRRVAEKIGFTIEGIQRLRIVQRGERQDAWAGGLLREDLR